MDYIVKLDVRAVSPNESTEHRFMDVAIDATGNWVILTDLSTKVIEAMLNKDHVVSIYPWAE